MKKKALNFAYGTNELPELRPWQKKWKAQADQVDDLSIVGFQGLPDLQEAIYRRFDKKGVKGEMSTKNVMVTCGGTEAIFTSLLWIKSIGGRVILQHPSWGYFSDTLDLLDIPYDLSRATTAEGLGAELSSLEKGEPVMYLLTHPSNPLSQVFSVDFLQVLSDWVQRNPSNYVLSDEIYDWYMTPEDGFCSWATFHGLSQSIIVHGYSKATGLAGYRIGYLVAEYSLYKKLFPFHYSSSYGAAVYSQHMALKAQADESDIRNLLQEAISRRWEILYDKWNDNTWLKYRQRRSGMYAYIDIESPQSIQKAFISKLKDEHAVWVNPGWNFGIVEGGFRLNLCRAEKELELGLDIILQEAEAFLSNLR